MFSSSAIAVPYFLLLLFCTATSSSDLSPRDATCTVSASPPGGSPCGVPGTYTPPKNGAKFLTRQFTTLETCAQFCSDASLNQGPLPCATFLYHTDTNQCVLFQRPASRINFTQDDSSSAYLYSYGCYDCPLQCEPPPGQNLFNNPSFNLSKTRLGPWVIATTIPHILPLDDGGNAVTYKLNPQGTNKMEIDQYRYLCDNEEYLLSFDMKLDVTNPNDTSATPTDYGLQLVWQLTDCSYSGILVPDNTPLGTWRTFGCSIRRYGFDSRFALTALAQGPAYDYQISLANMKLTRLSGDPINTVGASVLTNGDFEDATANPWTSTSDYYTYYDYSNTNPPDECTVKGKQIPNYSLVKPGLPPSSGAPASHQAFRFCGVTPPLTANQTYDPENKVTFDIVQEVDNHPFEDKLYLLSATYQTLPANISASVTLLGYSADGASVQDILYTRPVQSLDGSLMTLQQQFYGSAFGSSIFSLQFEWQADTFSPYYYDGSDYDYSADPAQLQVILDNVSIREVVQ